MNIMLLIVLMVNLPVLYSAEQSTVIDSSVCNSNIKIANSPYVIEIFCEDALGIYVGIVYRSIMAAPRANAWSIDDRYWQVKDWSADVRSILPIRNNKELLISTSGEYGTPGIYLLKLSEKKWIKAYSGNNKAEHSFVIQNFESSTNTVVFRDDLSKDKKVLIIKIDK